VQFGGELVEKLTRAFWLKLHILICTIRFANAKHIGGELPDTDSYDTEQRIKQIIAVRPAAIVAQVEYGAPPYVYDVQRKLAPINLRRA
jgi:hypothetical protein